MAGYAETKDRKSHRLSAQGCALAFAEVVRIWVGRQFSLRPGGAVEGAPLRNPEHPSAVPSDASTRSAAKEAVKQDCENDGADQDVDLVLLHGETVDAEGDTQDRCRNQKQD